MKATENTSEDDVSIPKRVSEALNQRKIQDLDMEFAVSIPKRVSEALNPGTEAVTIYLIGFQSLKGFQRL